jgi:hypothetical protein
VIPLAGNSLKPFFRGRFIEKNGRAILIGHFSIHWLAKVLIAVWFFLLIIVSVFLGFEVAIDPRAPWIVALFAPGMFVGGIGMVWLGTWFARNDVAWLSDVIVGALRTPGSSESIVSRERRAKEKLRRRLAMTIVVPALLGLLGMLTLWVAASGGHSLLHVSLSAAYGLSLLAMGYGVFQRKLLAWRTVLALPAGVWLYSIVVLFLGDVIQMGAGGKIVFSVESIVVMFLWWKWWHAQRSWFEH